MIRRTNCTGLYQNMVENQQPAAEKMAVGMDFPNAVAVAVAMEGGVAPENANAAQTRADDVGDGEGRGVHDGTDYHNKSIPAGEKFGCPMPPTESRLLATASGAPVVQDWPSSPPN